MGVVAESAGPTLDELRRRMAAIPGRGESRSAAAPSERESGRAVLSTPLAIAELLPEGGLRKGDVVEYTGASSLLAGLVAAVTASGGHAALVGVPGLGLLAAAEMGARLERLAVVADPGPDPVEVAAVLLDGLDLIVLGLGGAAVPPARCRVIAARARAKGATLVVTDGRWTHPSLRLEADIAGYGGLGAGSGRLRSVALAVAVRDRAGPPRRGRIELRPTAGRIEWVRSRDSATGAAEAADVAAC
ncbi:hypothetical protein D5S18_23810 [Nocardia panacis]|uniref:Recombinase A n=1 Tax=Nocardia panacis TaxID=2340916 RepID=A0A3A4KBC6_9NOCA|nr:hypothetical protein [Nocardia panacis]RJO72388.1 hypothetical protein D5S18_23810 [Nocardia panacis]